jgi:NAD(P)-dependent dehydrogenase (short-subunit alcohol dehydrogenase family)
MSLGAAPYSVTKHAVVALAEWLAVAYGERGIRVSCLCPQFVATEMLGDYGDMPGTQAWMAETAITPEAVAGVVVDGLHEERFLILPHPEVAEYFQRRAGDIDRWLHGMRKLQRRVMR